MKYSRKSWLKSRVISAIVRFQFPPSGPFAAHRSSRDEPTRPCTVSSRSQPGVETSFWKLEESPLS